MSSRKAKGIPFTIHDVATLGATARLFDNSEIDINAYTAFTRQKLLVKGKLVMCYVSRDPLVEVMPDIKKVLDKSRVTIAERANKQTSLTSTGKGMTKTYHEPTALDVYWAL